MSFSKRMNIEFDKPVQLTSIDEELKNGIWNVQIEVIFNQLIVPTSPLHNIVSDFEDFEGYVKHLWSGFYKARIDEIPPNAYACKKFISELFFTYEYNKVYD